MRRQDRSNFLDTVNQRVSKISPFETCLHRFNHATPELFSALRMNSGVAHDRKFMGNRSDKNQDRIS